MSTHGHLAAMGLIGWNHLEVAILAGLLRRKPILFVGMHGGNKTEGSASLCRASVLYARKNLTPEAKAEFRFANYDAALLTIDDLLGFLNPKTLGEKAADGTDMMEFIKTPNSVWGADAALIDEITRADRGIAGKLMEFVRTGRIMGKQTAVKQVIAAANPPKEYDAFYMDLAFATRFMILNVPDSRTMDEGDFETVVQLGTRTSDKAEKAKRTAAEERLGRLLAKARRAPVTEADEREALGVAKEIRRLICGDPQANPKISGIKELKVSLRQFQEIACTYIAIRQLQLVDALPKKLDPAHVAEAILSWIPEVTGVVRAVLTSTNRQTMTTSISQIVSQMARGEILAPMPLGEVLKVPADDADSWGTAVVDAMKSERDSNLVAKAARVTRVRAKKKIVTPAVVNMVMESAVARMMDLGRRNLFAPEFAKTTMDFDRGGLIEAIGSLIEQRELPRPSKNPPKSGVFYNSSFASTDESMRNAGNNPNTGRAMAAAAGKVLVPCTDKKFIDQRAFGKNIPIVAMSKAQYAKERVKIKNDSHVIMVYTGAADPKDMLFIELGDDAVRVNSTHRDPVISQTEYAAKGIHFLWDQSGSVRLPDKGYSLAAILVNPTVQDLIDAEILHHFMQTSSADPLCKRTIVQALGQRYKPDYAKLYPSNADV